MATLIEERLGLSFPAGQHGDLLRGLERICREFHVSDASTAFDMIGAALETSELYEKLVAQLTVGETYFYRDPYLYDALRDSILPQMLASRSRPIAIWSAGCCSGEEPYSIAMLAASRHISGALAHILATDISNQALVKAREGLYSEWSFRNTPAWIRDRYFTPEVKNRWRIASSIKEAVTLKHLNLAADDWPSDSGLVKKSQFDIILCRNVLIYFRPEIGNKVLQRFKECLAPGGVLIVGPSEVSNLTFDGLRREAHGDLLLFRKLSLDAITESTDQLPDFVSVPLRLAVTPEVITKSPSPVAASCPANRTAPAPDSLSSAEAHVAAARQFCVEARFDQALAYCRKAVAADPEAFAAHYLMGSILLEAGDTKAAEKAFTRALYVHPQHVLAQFGLGEAYRLGGQVDRALRQLRLVRRYACGLPRDRPLSHGEGLTAGVLCSLIDSSMSRLAGSDSV